MLGSARCTDAIFGSSPRVYRELERAHSPDGRWDAILTERESHATVATPTEVFLVSKGAPIAGEPVWLADHAEGAKFNWLDNATLDISATQARTFRWLPRVRLGAQHINVHLTVARIYTAHPSTAERLARSDERGSLRHD